jgi:inner membrane protein
MYEILAGLRIHPMQYFLVGLSVALFYLLLLSFAEIIGFLPAYLVSTVAITLLITGYCISILKVRTRAFSITALLLALYGYLYTLLQLEELSLIFGSILLFGVLTTVMHLTRNLDWYSLKKPPKT